MYRDTDNHSLWKRLVSRGISLEVLLEGLLVIGMAGYFVYLLLAVGELRPEAARLPRMTAIGGLILIALFIAQKLWRAFQRMEIPTLQILDTGFDEEGLSRRLVALRTLRVVIWFGAMLGAIWLIGYHVTIPVFVGFYLFAFGETKWWAAISAGAAYLLLIYVLFDLILRTEWPEPALLRWIS
jgi:hypothetical protein